MRVLIVGRVVFVVDIRLRFGGFAVEAGKASE